MRRLRRDHGRAVDHKVGGIGARAGDIRHGERVKPAAAPLSIGHRKRGIGTSNNRHAVEKPTIGEWPSATDHRRDRDA